MFFSKEKKSKKKNISIKKTSYHITRINMHILDNNQDSKKKYIDETERINVQNEGRMQNEQWI